MRLRIQSILYGRIMMLGKKLKFDNFFKQKNQEKFNQANETV